MRRPSGRGERPPLRGLVRLLGAGSSALGRRSRARGAGGPGRRRSRRRRELRAPLGPARLSRVPRRPRRAAPRLAQSRRARRGDRILAERSTLARSLRGPPGALARAADAPHPRRLLRDDTGPRRRPRSEPPGDPGRLTPTVTHRRQFVSAARDPCLLGSFALPASFSEAKGPHRAGRLSTAWGISPHLAHPLL